MAPKLARALELNGMLQNDNDFLRMEIAHLKEHNELLKKAVGVTDDLAVAAEALTSLLGCGDNSCLFVKPKGMATNGGCRCWEHLGDKGRQEQRNFFTRISFLLKEVRKLTGVKK